MFASVFWVMIVAGCYIAIGIYFVAFYYTKRREEKLKALPNIQVRDVHSKETLFIKHLLPIVIVNILFEAAPYTIRALVSLHFLHPKYAYYCSDLICPGLIAFPLIHECCTGWCMVEKVTTRKE
ncbi:nucleolar MIF4G domain-containing protein 1 [Trichinella spiralis]|uniref:nucleolar MIF4G domain-containing protein 1 n=1 Tax=Trichinella spiralis TaxID=6334 RepID=UPI0001EFC26D|nr:nucleolar MIF4G domain-containing protein 1 [Trichinella spiralis]